MQIPSKGAIEITDLATMTFGVFLTEVGNIPLNSST